ncbi:MAG: hypothetical protein RR053_07500, partial [Evtepia sp.]
VIMADSRPDIGSTLIVSLPIQEPKELNLRSEDAKFDFSALPPVLAGLSDALPWQAFLPLLRNP